MRIVAVLLAALLAGCSAKKPEKITILYPTRASQTWPLYIAKEGGYYEKYGFDVDLQFGVHPAAIVGLVNGEVLMSPYTLEQSMTAAIRDQSLALVGSPYKKSSFALVAAKGIGSVGALKGKRIAVSQIGDAPYNYAVGLLARAGLTPRDVEWVPVGTGAGGRAKAVAGAQADATMLTAPEYYKLEAAGFAILANIADADEIHAPSVYLFKRSAVEGNDIAERMIKVHAEAIKRFYDDKAFAVDAYLKWDKDQTRADVERVWDEYSKMGAYERIPFLQAAAVQYVLDHPASEETGAAMRAFDFHKVVDNRTVDKLMKEGYFEEVFGSGVKAEEERRSAGAYR